MIHVGFGYLFFILQFLKWIQRMVDPIFRYFTGKSTLYYCQPYSGKVDPDLDSKCDKFETSAQTVKVWLRAAFTDKFGKLDYVPKWLDYFWSFAAMKIKPNNDKNNPIRLTILSNRK